MSLKESARFACGLVVFVDACVHLLQLGRCLPLHLTTHATTSELTKYLRVVSFMQKISRHVLRLQKVARRRCTLNIKPAQVLAEAAQQTNHRRGATEL